MLHTKAGQLYEAFGLSIYSELALPELPSIEITNREVDVTVSLDKFLRFGMDTKPYEFVAEDRMVTVNMPEAGVFRVRDGNKIIVAPYIGAQEDLIRLYVLGTCFGILLMQRGIYPLHGSALAINGKAYAIVGQSGAGKSTLAAVMMEKGYKLLSDDVIAVAFDPLTDQPIVIPSYPQQKLWQSSLKALGRSEESLRSIYGRETKYCIPLSESYHVSPLPLAAIFELSKSNEGDRICLSKVNKLDRLPLLFQHTYRNPVIRSLNLIDWHFERSIALATQLDVFRLNRPESSFTAPQLAELIVNTIATEEWL